MKKIVLILNYHRIDGKPGSPAKAIDNVFTLGAATFESQIKILAAQNIPVISLDDLLNNRMIDEFSVAITCDDGNPSDFEIVYPVLKKYGMTCTFFWKTNNLDFIKAGQVREMIEDGFIIGSHGLSHQDLAKMKTGELMRELADSKKILEELTGSPVHYFAFPFGIYNNRTIEQSTRSGYKALFSTDAELITPGKASLVFGRWSLKWDVSPGQFERIITNKNALKSFVFRANMKKFVRRAVGRGMADKINLLLFSLFKRD